MAMEEGGKFAAFAEKKASTTRNRGESKGIEEKNVVFRGIQDDDNGVGDEVRKKN